LNNWIVPGKVNSEDRCEKKKDRGQNEKGKKEKNYVSSSMCPFNRDRVSVNVDTYSIFIWLN
jgi:hypothetical protein